MLKITKNKEESNLKKSKIWKTHKNRRNTPYKIISYSSFIIYLKLLFFEENYLFKNKKLKGLKQKVIRCCVKRLRKSE